MNSGPATGAVGEERVEIDLADAWRQLCYVRNDHEITSGLERRNAHLWHFYDWQVVLGERTVRKGDPLTIASAEFRQELVGLLGRDVRLYLDLFRFVVCRIRIDLLDVISRLLDSHISGGDDGTSGARIWPLEVQELDPSEGRLEWVTNRRLGTAYYEYTPTKDETLVKYWRYVVWRLPGSRIEPEYEREISLVSGVLSRGLFTGFMEGDGTDPRVRLFQPNDRGRARLHSEYRHFFDEARELAELRENVGDAESALARPTDYIMTRPAHEVAPEAVSEATRIATSSMTEAAAEQALEATTAGMHALLAALAEEKRAELQLPDGARRLGSSEVARKAHARAMLPGKRIVSSLLFERPLPTEPRKDLPDIAASVSRQAPSTLRDPLVYKEEYHRAVVRFLGPLAVLSDGTTGPGGQRRSTGAMVEAEAKFLADARMAQLTQLREEAAAFFAWMYRETFALIDMAVFQSTLDEVEAATRERIFATLTDAPTAGAMRALYRHLGSPGVRHDIVATALGAAAADDGGTTRSVNEMRHQLWVRLASRSFVPASLVFSDERHADAARRAVETETERAMDPELHARRLAEMKIVSDQARMGLVDAADLRALNKSRLGLETPTTPPPPPAAPTAGVKRPRPSGGGSSGRPTKRPNTGA